MKPDVHGLHADIGGYHKLVFLEVASPLPQMPYNYQINSTVYRAHLQCLRKLEGTHRVQSHIDEWLHQLAMIMLMKHALHIREAADDWQRHLVNVNESQS